MNGSPDTLFFTDGIDGETHGLLGAERKAYIDRNHAAGETWKFNLRR